MAQRRRGTLTSRTLRALLGLSLFAGFAAGVARSVAAAEVGFVYVPGNLGGGSGGHGALVIDEAVFHIQNRGDGLVYFVRDRWDHFEHVYTGLKNRPLHIAHVHVSNADRERILDQLSQMWVAQQLALAEREDLRRDVEAMEALSLGGNSIEVETAGLVDPHEPGAAASARLRGQLGARIDSGHLQSAIQEVESQIARTSIAYETGVRELHDRLALRESLRAVEHGWPLADAAKVRIVPAYDAPLTLAERRALTAYADQLVREWAELFASRRSDRGRAMLLTWARALAIQESLHENRLVLLDPLPAAIRPRSRLAEVPPESRRRWVDQTGEILLRTRPSVLSTRGIKTSRYNQLETLASALAWFASGSEDVALSDLERQQSPARTRSVSFRMPRDRRARSRLEMELERARARLAKAESAIQEKYAYDLFARNCITELERSSIDAFGTRARARNALGGEVTPDELFGFIPFVFFDRVVSRLRVIRTQEIPSYRTRRLSRDRTLGARIRESFAPLSHVYVPRRRDGDFLLFTDDVFWRRPLYGVANLAWGSLHLGKGALSLPWDRGVRLRSGFSGLFWSLPEIFFVNIRKGTFDWIEVGGSDTP